MRPIPLAPQLVTLLRTLHGEAGPSPSGYVLRTRRGTHIHPSEVYTFWQLAMRKAGLLNGDGAPLYTFHALRHTNVSLLIALGLQPFHMQKLIGHSSIAITMDIYGHMFPDDGSSRQAIAAAAAQFDVMRAPARLGASDTRRDAT